MNGGTLALGLLDGLLIGLLAVGLVLVYRSSRFLNLAHGAIGAVPALLLSKLAVDYGWPYWPALFVCLAAGCATAVLIERLLVARLLAKTRSAVSALLLTIGVSQMLTALTFIGWLQPDPQKFAAAGYPLPFRGTFTVGDVIFGGQYLAILVFCPALIVGLTLLLRYSLLGKMIRALASNRDAARLCGISPRLVTMVTWGFAGALSTFSAVLFAPSQTSFAGTAPTLGSLQLLLALGAAAFGAFVSVPLALVGGLALGVLNHVTLYETSNAGDARLAVFALIIAVILVRGRAIGAAFATQGSPVQDLPPVRVPPRVRSRPLVRHARMLLVTGGIFVGAVAPLLPPLDSNGDRFYLSLMLTFALIGVSLTILIGWGGQLSLGHMAVVGVTAFVAARLAGEGYGVISLLAVGGVLGAAVMLVVGLPALRVPGLTLAATTLGLAVVTPEYLFHREWFTGNASNFASLAEPISPLRGISVESRLGVYWTTLAVVVVVGLATGALRRSIPGRTMIAVRDDERVTAAYGITPTTVKLTTLAVSGAVAGFAGVLWANCWQSVSPAQFPPEASLAVLAVPVIGGIGSIAGAIAAAVLFYFPALFIAPHLTPLLGGLADSIAFPLFLGGAIIPLMLLAQPTGLAGVAQVQWERFLQRLDDRLRASDGDGRPSSVALAATDVQLSFGGVRALQGASVNVRPGEIVGLIGPNGAGKSTLINVMSGVLRADTGRVELLGNDITDLAPEIRAALGLGRSFQAATLFPGLTVRETLHTVLGSGTRLGVLSSAVRAPWVTRAERRIHGEADQLIDKMGLTAWADSLTSDLSTGTRRICDLTVHLANRPKVLLLDEPTAGVAQRETEAFGPLLRRIRDELNCSIIIVEHDMPLLMGVCDRVYAMVEGQVIAEGTPREIRADPRVIASYLGTDEAAINRSGTPRRGRSKPAAASAKNNGRSAGPRRRPAGSRSS